MLNSEFFKLNIRYTIPIFAFDDIEPLFGEAEDFLEGVGVRGEESFGKVLKSKRIPIIFRINGIQHFINRIIVSIQNSTAAHSAQVGVGEGVPGRHVLERGADLLRD
jgi:hypothetical protein